MKRHRRAATGSTVQVHASSPQHSAKHRMAPVPDFMLLESAFTLLQFAVVAPLVALACRGASVPLHRAATAWPGSAG